VLFSRSKYLLPAVALALGACSTRVVYLPAPTDTPAPAAQSAPPVVEPYYEPLEVTVGRPVRDRFVVQTNRPAYVAIFEVIPEEGITIVRPTSSRESYVVAGLSSVRVPWSATVLSRVSSYTGPRYLYAVASDEPLDIGDETFQPGFLRYTLGPRVYRSSDPYEVMRALSRHFVTRGIAEEEWAEDVMVTRPEASVPRIAYVYCPGGTS
jgi:hypothetical protein